MKDLQQYNQLKATLNTFEETSFFGNTYERYSYDDYEKLIAAKFDDTIQYICTDDLQGGNFRVGYVGTAKDWLETALSWCDTDENMELIHMLVMDCDERKALDEIQAIWDIEIQMYDKNNKEHLELKNYYETRYF